MALSETSPANPPEATPTPASQASTSVTSVAPASESDAPPAERVPSPFLEVLVNLIVSISVGAALLSFSCRIYRKGLPKEEPFVVPDGRRIVLTMIAICLVVCAFEILLVVWGRKCIQLDAWPSWLAVTLVLVLALFTRFVVAVIGITTLLRIALSETAEVMLFFSLLAFVPTVAFLGVLFAITVPT